MESPYILYNYDSILKYITYNNILKGPVRAGVCAVAVWVLTGGWRW